MTNAGKSDIRPLVTRLTVFLQVLLLALAAGLAPAAAQEDTRAQTEITIVTDPESGVIYTDPVQGNRITADIRVRVLPDNDGVVATGTLTIRVPVINYTVWSGAANTVQPSAMTNLPLGVHTLTVEYAGDALTQPSTASRTITVRGLRTTVTPALSPATPQAGQPVAMAATLSPPALSQAGVPLVVDFFVDGVLAGTAQSNTTTVTFTHPGLPEGDHEIRMDFRGFQTGQGPVEPSSATAMLPVGRIATTLHVGVSATEVTEGDTVMLTATVDPVRGDPSAPGGEVTFLDNGQPVGTTAVAGGQGVLVIEDIAAGAHAFTASYTGDTAFRPSTADVPVELVAAEAIADTTTTLSIDPNPPFVGQPVTLEATVAAEAAIPEGTVDFLDGTEPLGSATLVDGTAVLPLPSLAGGSRSLVARYTGIPDTFAPSVSAALPVEVERVPVQLDASASDTTPDTLDTVSVTVTVLPDTDLGTPPGGTVSVSAPGLETVDATVTGGSATFDLPGLPSGPQALDIAYSGDATHAPGATSLALDVTAAPTSLSLSHQPDPSFAGQPVTLEATVSSDGTPVPDGTVTFTVDGADTPVPVTGGTATLVVEDPSAPGFDFSAAYSGRHAPSSDGPLTHTVVRSGTTITLTSEANPVPASTENDVVAVLAGEPGAGTPDGLVTFVRDDGTETDAPVIDGHARISTAGLPSGTYTYTAEYPGNDAFAPAVSDPLVLVITKITVDLVVTADRSSSVIGESVRFTANAGSISGPPPGSVTFTSGGRDLGTVALVAGAAHVDVSDLPEGTSTVTASYAGDDRFAAATGSVEHTVALASTTTVLALDPSPAYPGQDVTLTAVVSSPSGTPAGEVEFLVDGTPVGTVALSDGTASAAWSPYGAGTRAVTARYAGLGDYAGSEDSADHVVLKGATAIVLSTPEASTPAGVPVTFTATITPVTPASGEPSGTVTFTLGTATEDVPLSGGTATFTSPALAHGQHTVSATYSGDADFEASTAEPLGHVAVPVATTTTVASAPNPSSPGAAVTLTATVVPDQPGTPTGTVTFTAGGQPAGTAALGADGSATVGWTPPASGTHPVTASYAGDSVHSGSASNETGHAVTLSGATLTLSSAASETRFGNEAVFTATVASTDPLAPVPGGTVRFTVDGAPGDEIPLSGGTATWRTSGLAVGGHDIAAAYEGDAYHDTATAGPLAHTVLRVLPVVSVTAQPSPSVAGAEVTLIANVTASGAIPSGTVEFRVDGASVGDGVLEDGSARLAWTPSARGTYELTAAYSGDADFDALVSGPTPHTVDRGVADIALSLSDPDPRAGDTVTVTATLTAVAPASGVPTGTVSFSHAGGPATDVTLSGGTATFETPALGYGTAVVTAAYSGDEAFLPGNGNLEIEVDPAPTTTVISVDETAPVAGQPVRVTATVTSAVGPDPSGPVRLTVDGATVATTQLSGGSAVLAWSAPSAGTYALSVAYDGEGPHASSVSAPVSVSASMADATVAVTAAPSTSTFGETVTFTATVAPVAPATAIPGGTVTFTVDGVPGTPVALSALGTASFQTSSLGGGTRTVVASYSGDAAFNPAVSEPLQHEVSTVTVSVTASVDDPAPAFGEALTLSATVSSSLAAAPSGTVEWVSGDGVVATAALSGGSATSTWTPRRAGSHQVFARYGGDNDHGTASSDPFDVTVAPGAATLVLSRASSQPGAGDTVVVTAEIVPTAPADEPAEGGTVNFVLDGQPAGSSPVSGGVATFSTGPLAPGHHTVSATYSGYRDYTAAGPSELGIAVADAVTSTALSLSNPDPVPGETVQVTVTVSSAWPPAPQGEVSLAVDGAVTGTATLSGGSAVFDWVPPSSGSFTLSAEYAGQEPHAPSGPATLVATVGLAGSDLALTAAEPSTRFGDQATFTAVVTPVPPATGTPTGDVRFFVDDLLAAEIPLVDGTATFRTSAMAAGNRQVTARYPGDGRFAASQAGPIGHEVTRAGSSVQVSASPSPASTGEQVSLTASVAGASGRVPSGTVTFTADGQPAGTATLENGTATVTWTPASVGQAAISATYGGDAGHDGSSGTATLEVVAGSVTISLSSASTPLSGETATVTATVTPVPPSVTEPGGIVTFSVDGVPGTPVPLSGGTATFETGPLSAGTRTVTATYSGDAAYGQAFATALPVQVGKLGSSVTAIGFPNPGLPGQPVALTATVASDGNRVPTGTVEFLVDGVAVASGTVAAGTASASWTPDVSGSVAMVARYAGDSEHTGSESAPVTQVTNAALSDLSLSIAPAPSRAGQAVTVTATVTAVPPGTGTPSGEVALLVDGNPAGTATLAGGTATLVVENLPVGPHTFAAAYGGDARFSGTTATEAHLVERATTATVLSVSGGPGIGMPVTLSATVLEDGPGEASGTVTFTLDGTVLGTGTLSGNAASLQWIPASTVSGELRAAYEGDAVFEASVSDPIPHAVDAGSARVTLSAPGTASAGDTVPVTATVAALPPASGVPTGTVQFSVDGLPFGSPVALAGGEATASTPPLTSGNRVVTATYSGDTDFNGASATAGIEVAKAASSTRLISTLNPSQPGQVLTLIAEVTSPSGLPVSGTVTFLLDGNAIGTGTLAGGDASLNWTPPGAGEHTVTASYGGDDNHQGSVSGPLAQSVPFATTVPVLSSAPSPSVHGDTVTFTVDLPASVAATPTGTVTFTVDGTALAPVAVSGGSSAVSVPDLPAGTVEVTAAYSGDGYYAPASAGPLSHQVDRAATDTSLAVSPSASVTGQSVTLTAAVSSTATPPLAGTVTFSVDGAPVGTATLSGGLATLQWTPAMPGDVTVTAAYDGNAGFAPSVSDGFIHSTGPAATDITLSGPVSVAAGQGATLTATVATRAPGSGTPTGTVSFTMGGTTVDAALAGGTASWTTPPLAQGSHTVEATYSGDTARSGSGPATASFDAVAGTTATTLSSSPNPSRPDRPVTLTATVSADGGGTPTGTVEFRAGGTLVGSGTLSGGTASVTWTPGVTGTYTLAATYLGDLAHGGSASAPVTHSVELYAGLAETAVTLVPDTATSLPGDTLTVTATVAPVAPATGTPTGTVTFTVNGGTPVDVALSGGTASFTTPPLVSGDTTVTASYSGDEAFRPSSGSIVRDATPGATTTTLASSPNPSRPGYPVTLTATVASSAGTPTGDVTFAADGTPIGTATLSGGTATFTWTPPAEGNHALVATYGGDTARTGSQSAELVHTVALSSATVTLSASPASVLAGGTMTVTATVAPVAPETETPTGTVTFTLDGGAPFDVALSGGTASFDTPPLAEGTVTVTASYSGNGSFRPATADPLVRAVSTLATTSVVSSSPNPSRPGTPVTLSATVSAASGTPAGDVTFAVDGTPVGTATLSGGTASVTWTPPHADDREYTVTATYAGAAPHSGSASQPSVHRVEQFAGLGTATLALEAEDGVVPVGGRLAVKAVLTPVAPAAGVPTGTVFFSVDGGAPVAAGVSDGRAEFATPPLAAGTVRISAYYSGDTAFRPTDIVVIERQVAMLPTSTALASSANPSVPGQEVAFTATVSGGGSGTVTFAVDGVGQASVPLSGSVASWSTALLAEGTHEVTAAYSGDAGHAASVSPALVQSVVAEGTVTIRQVTGGTDGRFTFSSPTPALNVAVTTSGGSGQSPAIAVPAGTHEIIATDMTPAGFALSMVTCSDGTAGNAASRRISVDVGPGEALTCTFSSIDTRTATVEAITSFLDVRAGVLSMSLPDAGRRIDRLRGTGGGGFDPGSFLLGYANVLDGAPMRFSGSLAALDQAIGYREPSRFDVWAEGTLGKTERGGASGDFVVGSAGADYLVDDGILAGVMVQVDSLTLDGPGSTQVSGTGFLAGPYLTMELADGVYLDMMALAGTSTNKVSPFGTYTDTFAGFRYLVDATLQGQWDSGPWTFSPAASVTYFSETTESFTDSMGVTILEVTVAKGRASAGPGVSLRSDFDGIAVDTGLRLDGVIDLSHDASSGFRASDPRLRVEGSVGVSLPGGAGLDLSLAYEGLLGDDRTVSGRIGVNAPIE